jgi:hypothetical protein
MEFVEEAGSEFGAGEHGDAGSFRPGENDGESPCAASGSREFQTQEAAGSMALFERCLTVRMWILHSIAKTQ